MTEMHLPEAWSRVFEEIAASPGRVFMLGAPDTGKSTLARFLCSQSVQQGFKTAYVDGDLGQSVIGPPTTVGMVHLTNPPLHMETLGWNRLYFIGATSPANHLLATAAGVGRLAQQALEEEAQMVVVDTSGLVAGEMGFELKFYKIELLNPRHICAIQRGVEVEHILKAVQGRGGIRIHMLSPPQDVRIRTPEVRRAYRQESFEAYFSGSSLRTISLDRVKLISPELPLLREEGIAERAGGSVLGLNDEGYFTRGLGIWEGFDHGRKEVTILTPVEDCEGVRYQHLGHMTLTISPKP